jgi:hypothetical protein
VCDGLAFVCVHPFPTHLYPQLRYLDGSGSGVSPASLQFNVYLTYCCGNCSNCKEYSRSLEN